MPQGNALNQSYMISLNTNTPAYKHTRISLHTSIHAYKHANIPGHQPVHADPHALGEEGVLQPRIQVQSVGGAHGGLVEGLPHQLPRQPGQVNMHVHCNCAGARCEVQVQVATLMCSDVKVLGAE